MKWIYKAFLVLGGTVTNFEAVLTYPDSDTNIPSEYKVSYDVNGIPETHTYSN